MVTYLPHRKIIDKIGDLDETQQLLHFCHIIVIVSQNWQWLENRSCVHSQVSSGERLCLEKFNQRCKRSIDSTMDKLMA